MKIFEVNYNSPGRSGYDIFICKEGEDLLDEVKKRYGSRAEIEFSNLTTFESVRVNSLTIADLLKIIKM